MKEMNFAVNDGNRVGFSVSLPHFDTQCSIDTIYHLNATLT